MVDVDAWLASVGLGQYAGAFRANAVDFAVLKALTADDLKEIGVGPVGDRRKLLEAIASLSAAATQSKEVPARAPDKDAERRHLTVMFVDLVGSTELSRRLDPEDMREVIRAYQNSVASEVARFEGHVAKYMGDGVLAYFGWPRAHEDEAERAVRAGLAIAAKVPSQSASLGWPLQARIGIATGLVVVGDLVGEGAAQEEAVVGDTPNLAARLQGLAAPGNVVVAEATRRLVGQTFDVEDLGPQSIKGIAGQTSAFRVIRDRPLESRFTARQGGDLAPLVGRDQELGFLIDRWQQAQSGEGQLLLLTGEAGIGKSRLAEALVGAAGPQAHLVLRFQCSPYHTGSPLYPISQQVNHAAMLSAGGTDAEKLDRLEALLAMGTAQVREAAPFVAGLLALKGAEARYGPTTLSPQQRRARTLAVLVEQLRGLARRGPVLWLLEDAHWIDPTTLELIELALDDLGAMRVMMLITARPTFAATFASHPVVTRLSLNRLARAAAQAIARRTAGGKSLPGGLIDEISARTDGVPLYVEEMVKAVLESGSLRESENAYHLDGPLSALAVPATLHDSLMARLDRLHGIKEVAQTASIIGRGFDHATLAALAGLPGDRLADALNRLVEAELVFRRGMPPDATYLFKHALVRDAAYESLLKARRTALHARLLDILDAQDDVPAEVKARHAEAAGHVERAVDLWEEAGRLAIARHAYREGGAHLARAAAICRKLSDPDRARSRELSIQLQLGRAMIAHLGWSAPLTMKAFGRAVELVDISDSLEIQLGAGYGHWSGQFMAGHDCAPLVEALYQRAACQPNEALRLMSLRRLGSQRLYNGRFKETAALMLEITDNYLPEHHSSYEYGTDLQIAAETQLCWSWWHLGLLVQAGRLNDSVLSRIESIEDSQTLGQILLYTTQMAFWMRKLDEVQIQSRRLIDMSEGRELALWRSRGLSLYGASVGVTDFDEGLRILSDCLKQTEYCNAHLWDGFDHSVIADLYSKKGLHETAAFHAKKALSSINSGNIGIFKAECYRIRASIHLRRDKDDWLEAQQDLIHALETARHQEALTLELRAARDLALLLAERGERPQAFDLLRPVYDRITEVPDLPDVVEARVLLLSLSG